LPGHTKVAVSILSIRYCKTGTFAEPIPNVNFVIGRPSNGQLTTKSCGAEKYCPHETKKWDNVRKVAIGADDVIAI